MNTAHDERLRDAQSRPIREVAAALGVTITNDGKRAYCPDHSRGPRGGTPSLFFSRRSGEQRFKCFGCGAGGDVVDLVQWRRDCGFREALDWLLGPLPDPPAARKDWAPIEEAAPPVPYKLRAAACGAFWEDLPALDAFGLDWLLRERGITAETAERFGLRLCGEGSAEEAMGACIRAGIGAEVLVRLGLAKLRSDGSTLYCPRGFAYHLVIPYRAGPAVGHLQFRRIHRNPENAGKGPKYVHLKGEVPYPFGLDALGSDEPTVAVEGALDAMILSQGGTNALGLPGASWLNPDRARRIVRKARGPLIVGFDADEAGIRAQKRAVGLLQAAGARPDRVIWPEDFEGDWCDWSRERPGEVAEITTPPVQLQVIDGARQDDEPPGEPEEVVDIATWAELLGAGTERKLDRAAGLSEVAAALQTGYDELDRLLEIEPGDYVLIAGRGGEGKTHFLLSLMERAAREKQITSGLVSLEMSRQQLAKRLADASMMTSKGAALSIDELQGRADRAMQTADRPIYIDFGDRRLSRVVRTCRRLVHEYGAQFIGIDYVQYIQDDVGGIRPTAEWFKHVPGVSKTLKALFRDELRVPMLLAAQMKHPSKPRTKQKGSGRPRVGDLSGSITLSQDAEVIMIVDPPHKSNEGDGENQLRITIAKQNNGATGEVTLAYPVPFGWLTESSQARLPGT